jgi:hypothetical protein
MVTVEFRERLHMLSGLLKQWEARIMRDDRRHAEGKYERIHAQVVLKNRRVCDRLKIAHGL